MSRNVRQKLDYESQFFEGQICTYLVVSKVDCGNRISQAARPVLFVRARRNNRYFIVRFKMSTS